MGARIYDNLSDAMTGLRGWSSRTARAAQKHADRRAEVESEAYQEAARRRRIVGEELDLRRAVTTAEERLNRLRAKLEAAKQQAANMLDASLQTGDVSERILKVKATIATLPDLIARAEDALAAARQAHAAHVARHAPAPAPVVEDLAPAATTTKKGKH